MKFQFPWRKKSAQSKYDVFEGLLEAALKPVAPRQEFLNVLRQDLVGKKEGLLFGRISPKTLRMGVLGVGAALSGALIMVAGLRWVLTLLGALGLIQLQRQKHKEQHTFPNQPAL
jgi:hypothetical protein